MGWYVVSLAGSCSLI